MLPQFQEITMLNLAYIAYKRLLSVVLVLCSTWVHSQTIVDATQVQDALKRGVQVWDVRDARDFEIGRAHV